MPQLGQPSQRAPAGNAHFRPYYGTENSKLNERSLELGTREQNSYRPIRLNQAQRNRLLPSKEQLAPDSNLETLSRLRTLGNHSPFPWSLPQDSSLTQYSCSQSP